MEKNIQTIAVRIIIAICFGLAGISNGLVSTRNDTVMAGAEVEEEQAGKLLSSEITFCMVLL